MFPLIGVCVCVCVCVRQLSVHVTFVSVVFFSFKHPIEIRGCWSIDPHTLIFEMDFAYFSELDECEWCGRTFTLMALKRHLPICKEHVLRYGKPLFTGGPPPDSKFSRARQVRTGFLFCHTHRAMEPP